MFVNAYANFTPREVEGGLPAIIITVQEVKVQSMIGNFTTKRGSAKLDLHTNVGGDKDDAKEGEGHILADGWLKLERENTKDRSIISGKPIELRVRVVISSLTENNQLEKEEHQGSTTEEILDKCAGTELT